MRSSKLLALALALLSTAATAQTINDVQQRPGNTQPWGAVINATGSQDVSQYNTSVGSNPTVDAFRFLQGSSAPSATPLFTMSTGGMVSGAATGSRQGAGTINAQGYFINGVALTGAPIGTAGGDLSGTYPNPTFNLTLAHTWAGQQTFVAPILGTPASGTLTNTTGFPVANLAGVGAGCLTWLATPSSANLRGCLTDESGTGLAYFQGGDIGTPSAGVGTNFTGTGASYTAGNATKLTTPRAIGIAGSTGLTATGVNFDGTAAINPALTGTLIVANGGTGDTGTAWGTYTPAISCGTGVFSVTSARFKTLGKTVFIEIDATITSLGTCVTPFTFTLPVTANSAGGMVGRESGVTGRGVICGILGIGAVIAACNLADLTALAVNQRFIASGVYESQ